MLFPHPSLSNGDPAAPVGCNGYIWGLYYNPQILWHIFEEIKQVPSDVFRHKTIRHGEFFKLCN